MFYIEKIYFLKTSNLLYLFFGDIFIVVKHETVLTILSVQFSNIVNIHNIMQPSTLFIARKFSSPQRETLYSLTIA